MRINTKMNNLLKKIDINNISDTNINLNQLFKLIKPTFKIIHGCLIIDNNDEVEPSKVNLERILKIHGDKTGYEASSNEMRINDFINSETNEFKNVLAIGFMILDIWSIRLKDSYPNYRFCLIISSHEELVTLRFHQIRDDENNWLSDDLESYEEAAIAYKII